MSPKAAKQVPVHNEVEISDSTQEDTADDSFSLGGAFGLSLLISVRHCTHRVHGVPFADEIRAYTDDRKPVCGKRRASI